MQLEFFVVVGIAYILLVEYISTKARMRNIQEVSTKKKKKKRKRKRKDQRILNDVILEMSNSLAAGESLTKTFQDTFELYKDVFPKTYIQAISCKHVGETFFSECQEKESRESYFALAAAICLAEVHGVTLKKLLENIMESITKEIELEGEISSLQAGPKATITILALLPVFGIFLAQIVGARPIQWLLLSTWGNVVFLIAILFEVCGFLWAKKILTSIVFLPDKKLN